MTAKFIIIDLTKQYIDLDTVNKFIEYNSDFSAIKPISEPHLDVVFMSYNEKDADKHYELLKKREGSLLNSLTIPA